jgi:RHS repeat-associated protein
MNSCKQNKDSVLSAVLCENKKYEAFGNLVWSDGTYDDNREFTGKEKDPTGFHYFGARYYSGDIGRFLSPDPHTLMPRNLKLANPQDLNPYVYCTNDPLKFVDPTGLYRTLISKGTAYILTQDIVNANWEAAVTGFSTPASVMWTAEREASGDVTVGASSWLQNIGSVALAIAERIAGVKGVKSAVTAIKAASGTLSIYSAAKNSPVIESKVDRIILQTWLNLNPGKTVEPHDNVTFFKLGKANTQEDVIRLLEETGMGRIEEFIRQMEEHNWNFSEMSDDFWVEYQDVFDAWYEAVNSQ